MSTVGNEFWFQWYCPERDEFSALQVHGQQPKPALRQFACIGGNSFLALHGPRVDSRSEQLVIQPYGQVGWPSRGPDPHLLDDHVEFALCIKGLVYDHVSGHLLTLERDAFEVYRADCLAPRHGFDWSLSTRHMAPWSMGMAIETIAMLRHLEPATPWGPLPNELLFEIFSFL